MYVSLWFFWRSINGGYEKEFRIGTFYSPDTKNVAVKHMKDRGWTAEMIDDTMYMALNSKEVIPNWSDK